RKEVAAERLDVERVVRRRLRPVDDHDRALLVRPVRELLDGVDRSERVRDEVVGDYLDLSLGADRVEIAEIELPVGVDVDHPEAGARSLRDVLPGDEVRVVLELRHDHEVAGTEVVQPPRVGDEVERLGRLAGEDHLAGRGRVDEGRDELSRVLEFGGGSLGERVDAAVHVRVRRLVEPAHRVQHLPRLLGGHGRIEVRKRLSVDLLLEDRKIRPETLSLERGSRCRRHGAIVPLYRVYEVALSIWRGPPRIRAARRRLWWWRRLRAGRKLGRSEGLRERRLRWLPHAQGRGLQGPGRAE